MSDAQTRQTSFTPPVERSKEVLRRCAAQYDPDTIIIAVSGGTDSVVAADVMCRYGPEVGLEPDAVAFIDTGAKIPQTELVARTIADMHDLEFVKQGYRNQRESLAVRILENGWPGGYPGSPATGGHGLEWANRKSKPMEAVYMLWDGLELWVSGARKLESKQRSGNVPDSGIEKDKPRRVWASVIGGWTSEEKRRYIKDRGLPVSESYIFLGFSGECTACAFDSRGLLPSIDLLCPELGYCIRFLTGWLYLRIKAGEVDLAPKRLCWGWDPDEEVTTKDVEQEQLSDTFSIPDDGDTSMQIDVDVSQEMVGCDPESCGGEVDTTWIENLPDSQLVTREDVTEWWDSGELPARFPV